MYKKKNYYAIFFKSKYNFLLKNHVSNIHIIFYLIIKKINHP